MSNNYESLRQLLHENDHLRADLARCREAAETLGRLIEAAPGYERELLRVAIHTADHETRIIAEAQDLIAQFRLICTKIKSALSSPSAGNTNTGTEDGRSKPHDHREMPPQVIAACGGNAAGVTTGSDPEPRASQPFETAGLLLHTDEEERARITEILRDMYDERVRGQHFGEAGALRCAMSVINRVPHQWKSLPDGKAPASTHLSQPPSGTGFRMTDEKRAQLASVACVSHWSYPTSPSYQSWLALVAWIESLVAAEVAGRVTRAVALKAVKLGQQLAPREGLAAGWVSTPTPEQALSAAEREASAALRETTEAKT